LTPYVAHTRRTGSGATVRADQHYTLNCEEPGKTDTAFTAGGREDVGGSGGIGTHQDLGALSATSLRTLVCARGDLGEGILGIDVAVGDAVADLLDQDL
jgi:hypothetical protein